MAGPFVQQVIGAASNAADLAFGPGSLVLAPGMGGTLPLYLFTDVAGKPAIVVPVANHDNNQHAPAGGADGDARVQFEGVGKSYDGRTLVVEDFNLTIRKGEFVTLLGPSGSGKTTILMMLAGFQRLTTGTIRIDGRSVEDLPPRKRGIGMVFQNYTLFPTHDRRPEPRVPAGSAGAEDGGAAGEGGAGAASGPPRGSGGPAPGTALLRAAAARGDCPGTGLRARPDTHGRAAGRARPQPARGDAVRDPAT